MFITHTYLGTTRGSYRCLFFLLLEDYIEAQSQLLRQLNPHLERFARRLGDAGALVRPFEGDIEHTRQNVLDKRWPEQELREIRKTPGLLMINRDFDSFDPQEHPWIYINFGERIDRGVVGLTEMEYGDQLRLLAEAVHDTDKDVFATAHSVATEVSLGQSFSMFEARPGILGFSIDLVRSAEVFRAWCQRLARSPHESE